MLIDKTHLEWILIASIGAILVFTFADFSGKSTKKEVIIDESAYEDYPLVAWKDTHEKWNGKQGDILKIKYRVFNDDTFIQVVNDEGVIVHTQLYQRSPWEDGRFRDFTYTWMLYYTEDYGDDIPPGEYEIRVCYKNSINVDLSIIIII
jgi:hypothetical protein